MSGLSGFCSRKQRYYTSIKNINHIHAGMFGALQDAATYALNNYDAFLEEQNITFKRRRDEFS